MLHPAPRRFACLALLLCPSLAAQSLLGQYGERVMSVGSAVPGLPGATISSTSNFDLPCLDLNGTMVFRARMAGGGVTNNDDRAYFLGRASGDLQMVVRAGGQAPGLPAGTLLQRGTSPGSLGLGSAPLLSPLGNLLFFQSELFDPTTPGNTPATADTALFLGPVGNLQPLAREGDGVPFLAGATWGHLTADIPFASLNGNGRVLFQAPLGGAVTTADDSVLVTGTPGNLVAVVREGDVLPGGEVVIPINGSSTLSFVSQMNEAGQVLHELQFATGGSVTTSNDRALAVWTPGGGTSIILREGAPAPGLFAGVVFGHPSPNAWAPGVGPNAFTKAGNTLLFCFVTGGNTVTGLNDTAIYSGGTGGLQLVLRRGMGMPGLPGVAFAGSAQASLTCNDNGQIAFLANLSGAVTAADDSSTWFGTPGNLTLLGREGDVVAILPPSGFGPWRFGQMTSGTGSPYLNSRGQVLFQNTVTDGLNTRRMIFGYDALRGLHVVFDGFDLVAIPGGGGATWSAATSNPSNGSDGTPAFFNDNGDFVYRIAASFPVVMTLMRGHMGSMVAVPSSTPVDDAVPQTFFLDCTPAHAFRFYIVLATGLGTRPGFPNPLNPSLTVPLNWDPLWSQLSFDLANSPIWQGTIGLTDANGRAVAAFEMPQGHPGFQGTTLHHAAALFNFSLQGTFVTEPSALLLY
jgi:hypothetical protein